ncbi:MAG: hypothetical protein V4487_01865 [Chlamydiota bacterium]
MVLKAFLSRCPEEKKRALERFLPERMRIRLDELPTFSEEITADGFSNGSMLEHVHWSWFLPTLKAYPPKEQKPFLSALSPYAAENLAHALEISDSSEEMSELGKSYLRQILINSLVGSEDRLLPLDYLPPSPLKGLLRLSKKELIKLINFLSLYDLAGELRQIVETKILKKIYSFLSEDEKKILKNAMAHKESFLFPRMNLDRWDGSKESFRLLLHRRGLVRLGAALSGQDPDFIWYICHQLDIGRGNALFKLCAKEAVPGISDAVIRQIEELLANPDQLL